MELFGKIGIKPVILVTQIINFLILLFVLKKFLYKPILEVFEKRRKKIKKSLEDAAKMEKKVAELKEIEKREMHQIQLQAREIIREAKDEAEKTKQKIIKEAEKEAEELLSKTKQEIEARKKKIISEMQKETADLTVLATLKILEKRMDERTQKQLVEEAIQELDTLYPKKS